MPISLTWYLDHCGWHLRAVSSDNHVGGNLALGNIECDVVDGGELAKGANEILNLDDIGLDSYSSDDHSIIVSN